MSHKNNVRTVLLAMCLIMLSYTAMARDAVTVRTLELKEQASVNSGTITKLNKNQRLNVGVRKGSWYEVTVPLASEEIHGWVRMIDLRFDEALQGGAGQSGISILGSILDGESQQTVGTGVRGLDNEVIDNTQTQQKNLGVIKEEAQLKNSKINLSAVNEMDKFSVSKEKALFFAEQGQLDTQLIHLNDQ